MADASLSLHSILHCALALLVELKAKARRWSALILILGDSLLQNLNKHPKTIFKYDTF